ncbi:MAG: GNAT family N-acetyltransferase [Terriglobales bacterium]
MPSAPQDLTLPEKFSLVSLDDAHREAWDQFCAASDEAWFWHTSAWHNYTLQYRPDSKPRLLSFLCLSDRKPLAACPLILETIGDPAAPIAQFSFGGDAVPAPALANGLGERERSQVLRSIFQQVDRLAREHGVKRVSFRGSPPAPASWNTSFPPSNPFLRYGFHDVSLPTQVLDLTQDELLLLRSMRKGHRADIVRAEKMMRALVYDHANITEERFEAYRLLHRKAAGHVTRPLSTFRMMYDWIQRGLAILSCATLDDKPVGFAIINHYKDGAYYSSGCEDPEFNDLPIGHLLQWRAIQWLKLHRIRHYEVGVQFFGPQPHAPVSEKESKISFFKRGFGGRTVTSWRGEKFYDAAYARRVLEERARQFAEGMTPPPGSWA